MAPKHGLAPAEDADIRILSVQFFTNTYQMDLLDQTQALMKD
jgi:hypothetical protein